MTTEARVQRRSLNLGLIQFLFIFVGYFWRQANRVTLAACRALPVDPCEAASPDSLGMPQMRQNRKSSVRVQRATICPCSSGRRLGRIPVEQRRPHQEHARSAAAARQILQQDRSAPALPKSL